MITIKTIEADIETLLSKSFDVDAFLTEANNNTDKVLRKKIYDDYIRYYNFSDCRHSVLSEEIFWNIVDKNFPGDKKNNYITVDKQSVRVVPDDNIVRVFVDADISDDFYKKVEEIAYGNDDKAY